MPEPTCEQVRAMMPAYALNALDADELRLVQEHLDRCPEAQAAFVEHQQVAAGLLLSAPLVPAPPRLAARLEQVLLAEPRSAPPAPAGSTGPAAADRPLSWWRWGLPTLDWRRAATTAVVVLLGLLIATNLYWDRQVKALRQEQESLAHHIYEQESVLVVMGAGNAHRVELPSTTEQAPQAQAAVVYDPERTRAFVYVDDFPTLPDDRAYQLWLIRGDEQISGGLFTVRSSGSGTHYINAPDPLGTYDAIGITSEPEAGSEAPTGLLVVWGKL